MSELLSAVAPIGAAETASLSGDIGTRRASSFGDLLLSGVGAVEQQSASAMDTLAQYAAGHQVSPHELMIAMEQARLSLQLTVEVRNRLVEAYQEITRMQI